MENLVQNNEIYSRMVTDSDSILLFILALILSFIFSSTLKYLYLNFWRSISDKEKISANFVLLTVVVTIIITVVKSSLALSLGLVGALSIVRFRTPIKDPEELIFLFICIALGLSLGAHQFWIASVGFLFLTLIILTKFKLSKDIKQNNFFLTINDKDFNINTFTEKYNYLFETIVIKKIEDVNGEKEIIFNMRLKKNTKIEDLIIFLKKENIKNYSYFDQDNFFQI